MPDAESSMADASAPIALCECSMAASQEQAARPVREGGARRDWAWLRDRSEAGELDPIDYSAGGLDWSHGRPRWAEAKRLIGDGRAARRSLRLDCHVRQREGQVVLDFQGCVRRSSPGDLDTYERRGDSAIESPCQSRAIKHRHRRPLGE